MDDDSPDSTSQPTVQSNGRGPDDGPGTDDGSPSRPPEAGHVGPIYSTRTKVVVALVGLAAVAAMSWVYISTVDGNGSSVSGTGEVDDGVETVQPSEGSQVPAQTTVALDLAPGWDGRLSINGVSVPEDDLTRAMDEGRANPDPDRLELVPGRDRLFETLPSGNVCVQAELWRRADGPDGDSRTHEWCFSVF